MSLVKNLRESLVDLEITEKEGTNSKIMQIFYKTASELKKSTDVFLNIQIAMSAYQRLKRLGFKGDEEIFVQTLSDVASSQLKSSPKES